MAASIETLVDGVLKEFISETTKPEKFLSSQNAASNKFKVITKQLFDFGNTNYPIKDLSGGLAELFIDGFDEEQIWQQIELHNDPAFNRLMKNVAKIKAIKDKNITFKQIEKEIDEEKEEEVLDDEEDKDDESITSELSVDLPPDSEEDDDDEDGSDFDDDDNEDDLKLDEYKVLDEEREERPGKANQAQKVRKTEVDDKFFKLGEMEKFLEKEEAENPVEEEEDDEDEDIDFFEYIPSDDDDNEKAVRAKYKDFFRGPAPVKGAVQSESEEGEDIDEEDGEADNDDGEMDVDEHDENEDLDDVQPKGKRVKFDFDEDSESDQFDDDSESDAEDGKVKSSFEQRQERLRAKIREMEDEAMAPKPWQLMGETKAELRPENALLEEDLVFDHTTRQAPVITEETTRTLEDIIKQRIKDKAFDDVERKVKPVYDPTEYKKKLVLDQEKSKFSLAEIYEQEYLKQQELQQQANETKASSLADPMAEKQSDNAEHVKIGKMMKDLFAKLDALCNFHYTPRTPAPEIKIVSNMPSIAMEEIAPVAVSDANLLAPEEVQDHMRGTLKGDGEKDKTDRLRERRKKKSAQRVRHKERERIAKAVDKANPGLGNKHAKMRALQRLEKAEKEGAVSLIKDAERQKVSKSSTAFFKQLQEDVAASVDAVKREKTKAKDKHKRNTGSRLKL